jgi:ABC-2 type transport system ATP-binding protein
MILLLLMAIEARTGTDHAAPVTARPVVIEVRGLDKTFRIPTHRVDSFKERATHPFRRIEYREERVLKDISFDVHQGEFFGIVGRNGSGKSTLLKIMSSIYKADAGRIRVAGRLAPFIELGVGFNLELTSRENVVLNGVMMGLGRNEAARRLDAILDFAELREFADLKLKNYSSGMMVRLAFAVMVEADADIMLVDEVLAVGDAAFGQRCMDVFHARRRAGKTLVLVTHDMSTVESLCDRAMLIDDGEVKYLGDPAEAGMRYYRVNFAADQGARPSDTTGPWDVNVRLVDAWLEGAGGERVTAVEERDPIRVQILLEARRELESPVFAIHVFNEQGQPVFGFNRTLTLADGQTDAVAEGKRVRLSGEIENRLTPGRYFVHCYAARSREQGDIALHQLRVFDFVVYGPQRWKGSVTVDSDVEATLEP